MLRQQIEHQYGERCIVQAIRRAPRFGSSVFVVDYTRGARCLRVLGSVGRNGNVTEQSAMDLLHPERLVFGYERLMLAAFALVPAPRTALLLGLGGGAMCRHLDAYLPECAVTVVERDRVIIDLARQHFHIDRAIRRADAAEVVADARGAYDVILVDLYDAKGASTVEPSFWTDCAAALAEDGCLAVNWADFVGAARVRKETERIRAYFARSFFIAERGDRPNLVQLAPTDRRFRLKDLATRLGRFAQMHRLPREDATILRRCAVLTRFPATSGVER
jgi:spermidine synthase